MKNLYFLLIAAFLMGFCACKKEEVEPVKDWSTVKSVSLNYFRSSLIFMPETDLTFEVYSDQGNVSLSFLNTSEVELKRFFNTPLQLNKGDTFSFNVYENDCNTPPCAETWSSAYTPTNWGTLLENEWRIGLQDNSVVFVGVTYNF